MAKKDALQEKYIEDSEQLLRHRKKNFQALLGEDWPEEDVEALVQSEATHHELEDLLKNNCPKDLAIQILL